MNTKEFEVVKREASRLKLSNLYEAGDLYAAGWEAVEAAHAEIGDSVPDILLEMMIRHAMKNYIQVLEVQ